MNIEELKNLKNELDKVKPIKYVPYIFGDTSVDFTQARSLDEYKLIDDTDRLVQRFEHLMEMGTKRLLEIGISFDFVQVFTGTDLLVDVPYCEEFVKIQSGDYDDETKEKKLDEWDKNLSDHALKEYMYVSLVLDEEMFYNYGNVFRAIFNEKDNYAKSSGIVNIEKFISKIKDLGYIVTFDDCYEKDKFAPVTIESFTEKFLNNNNDDTILYFIADFREKEKHDNVIK